MDEELEQRGLTPKSFFDQSTETREMAQTAQKTSNSNLALLKELKEKVEIISNDLKFLKDEAKDRAFEEEDRKQKEEMEAKVKEQNEKAQGATLGDKGGVKEPEKKGLMGQVGSFLSNLIGGLVGGAIGFTLSGIGGLIGGTVNLGKKALDLGKNLRDKLFGKKKDKKKKGGKVKTDKLLGVVKEEDDDDENKKENDKELIKGELKEELKLELGIGDKIKEVGGKIKETGGNILGGIKKTLGGIKDAIGNFDERPGSRKTKDTKNEVIEKEESFSIPEGKKTSFSEALSGDRDTIHQFLYEQRLSSAPPGEAFNDFSGNPAYDSDVDTFLRGLKDSPQGYGIEINSGRVYLSKEKSVDGGYNFGRDTKYEGVKSDNEMYGDTFPKRSFSGSKKNTYERAILEFNEGGVVQKFDEGGEVDSVPAMLTPGEFVVTKDAVQKVGVDTLKGLNSSVGATNKPSLSNLEIGFGGVDMSLFEKKQTSVGGLDSSFMIDGEKQYLTPSQIKKQLTKMNVPYKELLNGMVIPDAAKMTADKMPEYYQKMKTVISETVPDEKMREKMVGELDKFMTKLAGGGDFRDTSQIEAEMNRYIPGTIENLGLQITESANKYKPEKKGLFQTQNFNEGGLVRPVIESKNESGEMELIQNLSQSVGSNSQNINVIQAQTQAMNPPNNNPQTTVPAEPSNTTLTGLQDTDAPIPFAMLLKQNAQRYLNLGNNAMVIS